MVDPQLEIEPYLEAAAQKSMRITHIYETHVQADHLSGARRLSDATGAPVIFHKSAPVEFPHLAVSACRVRPRRVAIFVVMKPEFLDFYFLEIME